MNRYHLFTWCFKPLSDVQPLLQVSKRDKDSAVEESQHSNGDQSWKKLSVANTSFCVCRISSFKWTLSGIHVHQEDYYQCFHLLQDWRRESDNKLYNSHSFSTRSACGVLCVGFSIRWNWKYFKVFEKSFTINPNKGF